MTLTAALLAACSGGGGGAGPATGTAACSANGQKQFVLDNMRTWYLWNDLLPASVNIGSFASAEDLLAFLTTFSPDDGSGNPVDKFSFITSAAADSAFFGEGQFEGFGFSSRFVAADDLRLTRVFTSSPAYAANLRRGQRILALNGRSIAEIQAAEGVNAVLDTSPVDFTMRRPDNSEFTVTIAQDTVTIDPVPQFRIIDVPGTPGVGYLELATFISTADPEFASVFSQFSAAGVTDVIVDLRYNGGGLVSTAELLGDYLGGAVAQGLVFSETRFNDDRAAANNSIELFELRQDSLNLSRLFIVATRSTASASELVTNSLDPHVEVVIVGDDTFGKPVGQIGLEFCDKILRPTAFQTVNSLGFGDYFDGLPVDCVAADDLNVPVGADNDPNVEAAIDYVNTGSCPVTALPGLASKPADVVRSPKPDRRGPPEREFADAY
ncbi:MAG: S41 family peptidase [Woeseiaceae bacterium]|nr:S41 family peptidase [Woeseiaceae bacterium]